MEKNCISVPILPFGSNFLEVSDTKYLPQCLRLLTKAFLWCKINVSNIEVYYERISIKHY